VEEFSILLANPRVVGGPCRPLNVHSTDTCEICEQRRLLLARPFGSDNNSFLLVPCFWNETLLDAPPSSIDEPELLQHHSEKWFKNNYYLSVRATRCVFRTD